MLKNVNWKRIKFVLSHAAVAGVVACIGALVHLAFGLLGLCIYAGYCWLKSKEFGEIVGKEKAAGSFVNDITGNLEALKKTFSSAWNLWQAEGAIGILIIVIVIFKVLF